MAARKTAPNHNKTLDRSSYEFMAALLIASFTQLISPWTGYLLASFVIAGLAIYFCWSSNVTAAYSKQRRFFLCSCSILFLVSVSYSPVMQRYREANTIPAANQYLLQWGSGRTFSIDNSDPPKVVQGVGSTFVTADGRLLDKYKAKFDLIATVCHVVNNEDYMQKTGISKSRLVNIRPEDIQIAIEYNTTYMYEMRQGASGDLYVLLAVPKGLRPADFSTLSDAEDKGAQIIGHGGAFGGPNVGNGAVGSPPANK